MFDYIQMIAIIVLLGLMGIELTRLERRINLAFDQNARLAASLIELEKKIDTIDESTGADIFKLRQEFNEFKTDYGEAAVEQLRQAAKSEKAWADGVNSIMSYGARYQGGGKQT